MTDAQPPQLSAVPLDYREQLVACLARYADELSDVASADAGALYAEWVRLVLALAHARLLDAVPPAAQRALRGETDSDWCALLALGAEFQLDVGVNSRAFE